MKDTINRSGEVIENLTIAQGDRRYAYAFAFGFAWSLLSEKNRKELLKISERKAQEKDND
jgi:hypothetical protein